MAGNAAQFQIVVTALDKASATMRQINRNVESNLVQPFAGVGQSIARLAEETGLRTLGREVVNVGRHVGELGRQITGLLGPLAALGAAASAAGLFEMAKSTAEWGEQLELASIKTGVAADSLAKLHYLAERNQVPVEQFDKALFKLNLTIGEAASGKNKLAAALFQKLHISLRDGQHHVRDAAALWADLSEAMARNTNATMRARMAATLFGSRMGADLIPMMAKGGEEAKKLFAQFERYYGKITPDLLRSLNEGQDGFEELYAAIGGLKFNIGTALIPVIQQVFGPIDQWIAANKDLVRTKVGEWARNVATAVKQIDWASVSKAVSTFAGAVRYAFDTLGPFWSTMAIGSVVMWPVASAAIGLAEAMGKLGWAVVKTGFKMTAFLYTEGLAGLALKIAMLTETAFPALSAAFVGLGAAIEATPIGWILTGVAAIAGAAYLVYEYWSPIKTFFGTLWRGVASAFEWGWDNIVPWIPGANLVKAVIDNWTPLTHFFSQLWQGVAGAFEWAYDNVIPWIPGANIVKFVIDNWTPLTQFFSQFWEGVASTFRSWGSTIARIASGVGERAVSLIRDAWTGLKSFFSSLWDGIVAIFRKAWDFLKPIIDGVASGAKWLANITGLSTAGKLVWKGTQAVAGAAGSAAMRGLRGAADVADVASGHRALSALSAALASAAKTPALSRPVVPPQSSLSKPLVGRQEGRPGKPPSDGKVHVQVDLNGLPAGAKAKATSSGANPPPLTLNTGHHWAN